MNSEERVERHRQALAEYRLSGMTWSPTGADGMIQIRCSEESDRFLQVFRELRSMA